MITPKVITAPTVEPVLWSEVMDHSRITDTDEQGYCEKLIKAVRQYLEHQTGRAFIQQTLEITLDKFPDSGIIELPRATPLVSVTSVKYYDSDAVEHTVSSSIYDSDTYSYPGRIGPKYNEEWPSFTARTFNPIVIRYVAGHVGADASPVIPFPDEDIKHAIRVLFAHFYEHREAVVVGDNVTIEAKAMELALAHLLAHHEIPGL